MDIEQVKEAWQKEIDDYVVQALTEDFKEYSPEIQQVIIEEAVRRNIIASADQADTLISINSKREEPAQFINIRAGTVAAVKPTLNSAAVFSLVFCFIFPIIGLPLALYAIHTIKKSRGEQYGMRLAKISLALNAFFLLMLIVGIIAAAFSPH